MFYFFRSLKRTLFIALTIGFMLSTFVEAQAPKSGEVISLRPAEDASVSGVRLRPDASYPEVAVRRSRDLFGAAGSGADEAQIAARVASERVAKSPKYREFAGVKVSESGAEEQFVLEFHTATRLGSVEASGDFHVTGGSCSEGRSFLPGESCEVLVTFTPTGVGHRTGALTVNHSAMATPFLTPIGGTAYGSAIQFTPSQMATVTGTLVSGSGLISGPGQLAVDGGDNLYMADPGNHYIRFKDSSGVIKNLIGGGTTSLSPSSASGPGTKLGAPTGVTVDYTGTLYFTDNTADLVGTYFIDNIAVESVGAGSTNELTCNTTSPCYASSVAITPPTTVTADSSGNVFLATTYGFGLPGSTLSEWTPEATMHQIYVVGTTAYNYYTTSNAVAPDPFGYGNLYYTYLDPGSAILSPTPLCYILGQNSEYSTGSVSGQRFWEVAGSGQCGFSGDGGRAVSAEIGKAIGQFAWDAAGNFYFTDTANNRVRRVDGTTGVIHTIAGNGSTGDGGDGGPSTSAQLQAPLGLGVDSTGRVYTTAIAGAAPKMSVRTFGVIGMLNFGSQVIAAHSVAQTVQISNVGNDPLNFAHFGFTSGSTTEYAIDPNTTSCLVGTPLASGASCNVGIIFTPGAVGSRTAVLTVLDDTISGTNTIQLLGNGVTTATLLPTPLTFTSQAVGSASAAMAATLKNTGTALLTINTNGITLTGSGAASFSETNNCGTTLAAGSSCTISVVFKPTTTGSIAATLNVADNAYGSLQTVSLAGTAVAAAKAAVSPTSLAFGSVTVATASAAKVVTLSNSGGAAMTISSYAVSGTNAGDFTQTHTCGTSLAAGANCTVSVVFKPGATGARTGTLAITTSGGTVSVALSGTGTAAAAVKAVTKISLESAAKQAIRGQAVVFTSQVSSSGAATATGVVQLKEAGRVLSTVTLKDGVARFRVLGLAVGLHMLNAEYAGDALHSGAGSGEMRLMVAFGAGPLRVRFLR
jgi:Bacterial Ig-like domain (group 3)/Abnormal spindle-like microcephaly-assoc'd, ASPM-SPD-2-Hydin